MKAGSAPTLSDVAEHAGVSLATASRALNGSVRVVRPDLKQLVEASARALGYTVNRQAQAVAKGATDTVALVVGDIADAYFSSIASGVVRVAREHGLTVTLTGVEPAMSDPAAADASEEAIATAVRAQRPRAVIFAVSREPSADWSPYRSLEGLTVIGPEVPGTRSVAIDNAGGAADLAKALTGVGYRDFTILASAGNLATVADRVAGFRSVVPECRVIETAFTRDGGYQAMRELLESGERPSCVFAVADIMAIGAMSAIRDAGLRPGADVAVAGFDDIPILRDLTPGLSTVSLPLEEIGAEAMRLALSSEPSDERPDPIRGVVRLRESTPGR